MSSMCLNNKSSIQNSMTLVAYALYAIVFVVAYAVYLVPVFGLNIQFIPGDFGDARLNMYFLEHAYRWAIGDAKHFWDAPFYYPIESVMTYSDTHLGSFPFYALFRLLGISSVTSYQLWMICGVALNYYAIVWLLSRNGYNVLGVCIGAFIYAFSSVAIVHLSHSQLLHRWPLPFALYFMEMFFQNNKRSHLYLFYLMLALQFYCSIYIGYFSLMYFVVLYFVKKLQNMRGISDYGLMVLISIKKNIISLCVFVVLLLPLFYPYIIAAVVDGYRNPKAMVLSMLPRLESYLLNISPYAVFGIPYDAINLPAKSEHIMYFGILPLLSVAYYVRRHRWVRINNKNLFGWIISLFVLFIITFNFNGLSLYHILLSLPGVNSIRAVTRVVLVMLLPISLIVAEFVSALLKNSKIRPFNLGIIVLFVALYFAENIIRPYRFSKQEAVERIERVKKSLPMDMPANTVLVFLNQNIGTPYYYLTELDAMLVSQSLGIPTMNGYSGRSPKGHRWLVNSVDINSGISDYISVNNIKFDPSLYNYLVLYEGGDGVVRSRWLNGDNKYFNGGGDENECGVGLDVLEFDQKVSVGKKIYITMKVVNMSGHKLKSAGLNPVRLTYRWRSFSDSIRSDVTKHITDYSGFIERVGFDRDIVPGEEYALTFLITPPVTSGLYEIDFELVEENVRFFSEKCPSVITRRLEIY